MKDYVEVVNKVKQFSQAEKLALLKVLADSLNEEGANAFPVVAPMPTRSKRGLKKIDYQPGKFKPEKDSSLFRMLGALRVEGLPAPNDQEVESMISDYLDEKYS